MAKRSPILGYNHNVRYRGLVFHVQTEDSGLLSPHLFTHLFYSGVIISTRKLVYDSGSAEDAIKSLMQAQHKAVMKDLRKGHFDDKIDQYLAGTPGLLPRGAAGDDKPEVAPAAEPRLAKPSQEMAALAEDKSATKPAETATAKPPIEPAPRDRRDSESIPLALKPTKLDVTDDIAVSRTVTPPRVSPPPRTVTAQKTSGPSAVRSSLPPEPIELNLPTEQHEGVIELTGGRSPDDSSPEIEIQLEMDDEQEIAVGRSRSARDTDLVLANEVLAGDATQRNVSDGVPGAMTGSGSSSSRMSTSDGSIPPLPAPPSDRKVSLGAASLPPARPISRPPSRPAITPPQVVSRPVAADDRARRPSEADSVEVYAPAPPSAEAPPGAQSERPGQYSQHSRRPGGRPTEPATSKSGSIPAGLGRPGRSQTPAGGASTSVPTPIRDSGSGGTRPRTPTPSRVNPAARSANNSGVVMTRPAVIVGAPSKPQTTTQRVRKAREDEGRGFGQGLISEKSLDEVILAYLSEDADDK